MAQRKVLIAEAKVGELRTFAREYLFLEAVKDNATRETILGLMAAAWDKDFILVAEAAPPSLQDEARHAGRAVKHDHVIVVIESNEEPGGDRPVELGCNGRIMLVERGKEQEIPYRFYESLKHAVTHRYEQRADGLGLNPVPRKVAMYPHQIIAEGTREPDKQVAA